MRGFCTAVIFGTLMAVPACSSSNHLSQTPAPTVSYHYEGDQGYEDALDHAERYCFDKYGLEAELLHRDGDGGDNDATFRCGSGG